MQAFQIIAQCSAVLERSHNIDERVQAFTMRGAAKFSIGDFDGCIEDCSEAIGLNENFAAEAYSNRGAAHFRKNDLHLAISDLDKALSLNETLVPALNIRSQCHKANGDNQKAFADMSEVVKLRGTARDYSNRAGIRTDLRQYDEAIEDCNEAIKLDKTFAPAYMNKGYALIEKGDLERGIKDLDRALELDPDLLMALDARGRAHLTNNNPYRALDDYSKIVKLTDKKDAHALYMRGMAFDATNNHNQAIKDFTETLVMKPGFLEAYLARGTSYMFKKDFAKAIDDFTEVLKIDLSNAFVYNNRGKCFAVQGEHEKAIKDYSESIRLDSGKSTGLVICNRAQSYFAIDSVEECIKDCKSALEHDCPTLEPAYYLGRCEEARGNTAEAAVQLKAFVDGVVGKDASPEEIALLADAQARLTKLKS